MRPSAQPLLCWTFLGASVVMACASTASRFGTAEPPCETCDCDPACVEDGHAVASDDSTDPTPTPEVILPQTSFYVVLVPDKLRRLGLEQALRGVLDALPPLAFIDPSTGLVPLRDFEHVVVASPNINDFHHTFMAVDHRVSRDELAAAIERASAARNESVQWQQTDGISHGNPAPRGNAPDHDPRTFALLEDGVAAYLRPEFLSYLDESGSEVTPASYVASLVRPSRVVARDPGVGLRVVLMHADLVLHRSMELPFRSPHRVELRGGGENELELTLRLTFDTEAEPEAFQAWWEGTFRDQIESSPPLRDAVAWIYDITVLSRAGSEVSLTSRLDSEQANKLLGTLATLIQQLYRTGPQAAPADRPQSSADQR